ncbi:MAG: iojap-like protein [Gammaproteobacteria bacterium]|nr:iojap-like protein [Gammaproteobacteria bacterium]
MLLKFILSTLDDMKAKDVTTLNVTAMTSMTDYMIICSGTSRRHTKSVAEHLVVEGKKLGLQPLGVEGEDEADWILVDFGAAVVHIMLPETREFYSLEKLWSGNEKVGNGPTPK